MLSLEQYAGEGQKEKVKRSVIKRERLDPIELKSNKNKGLVSIWQGDMCRFQRISEARNNNIESWMSFHTNQIENSDPKKKMESLNTNHIGKFKAQTS